jgi:ORF6N domain
MLLAMAKNPKSRARRIDDATTIIRGQRVILDSDLARLYGVTTAALNQAVKRNAARFPDDFAFRLTTVEASNLISQSVTSSSGYGGRRKPPRVFTEHCHAIQRVEFAAGDPG